MSKSVGPRLMKKRDLPRIKRAPHGKVAALPEVQATLDALGKKEHYVGRDTVLALELGEEVYNRLLKEGLTRPLDQVKQVLLYYMRTNKIPHGRVNVIGDKPTFKTHMVTVEAPN